MPKNNVHDKIIGALKKVPFTFWAISVSLLVIFGVSTSRVLDSCELLTYDLRFRLRPPLKVSSDIVIIEISDDTLLNLGKWPLPRDFHASLVDVLKHMGARMVVFDVLFSEPTLYDEVFSEAMKKAGNVHLASAFYLNDRMKQSFLPPESGTFVAGICDNLRPQAKGIGHANLTVDSDGKARRVPLYIHYNKTYIPQLGLEAACAWLGLDVKNVRFSPGAVTIDNTLRLPVLSNAFFMVNYPDTWSRSFKHFSYFQVLESYADAQQGMKPRVDLSSVKGKVCFVGLTATGTSDLRPMPLENIYPMMGLQASIFNSIVQKKFIRDAGIPLNTFINVVIFALCVLACMRFAPLKALAANTTLGIFYCIVATNIFIFWGLWVDVFFPVLLVGLTYVGSTLYTFLEEIRKRQILEKELDIARTIQKCFLPQDVKGLASLGVSSFMQPALFVGGDLYDIFSFDENKMGVFIGDVCGKGVPAALIMAQTISLFRIFSRQTPGCPEVLRRLNNELCGKFDGRFVTALYLIVDTQAEKARVATAGHGPVLVYKGQTRQIVEVELARNMPLGIMEGIEYKEVVFECNKGDKIVVFTDGVNEARSRKQEEFGIDRVRGIIADKGDGSSDALIEAVKKELFEFSARAPQHDDITLIVLARV